MGSRGLQILPRLFLGRASAADIYIYVCMYVCMYVCIYIYSNKNQSLISCFGLGSCGRSLCPESAPCHSQAQCHFDMRPPTKLRGSGVFEGRRRGGSGPLPAERWLEGVKILRLKVHSGCLKTCYDGWLCLVDPKPGRRFLEARHPRHAFI